MSGTISSLTDNVGTVVGSGSDAITLKVSEDSAGSGEGSDAQFTVNVDGQQIGGVQTTTASHAAGQDDTFTFRGDFAPGEHKVAVTFTNNNGTQGDKFSHGGNGDRNLYIDGVSYNGDVVSSVTTPVYESPLFPPNGPLTPGNAVFTVNDTTPVNGTPGVADSPTPGPVDVGSGADTLTLNMAEDPYQGDAQFTVAVDGKPVGGTLTTTAIAWQGQQQTFNLHGDWGSGAHTVTVDYISDHIGDTDATGAAYDNTDQNLFVMSGSYDGINIGGTPWELYSNGPHDFSVPAGGQPGNGGSSGSSSGNTSGTTTDTSTVTVGASGSGSSDSTPGSSAAGNTDNSPVATGTSGDNNAGSTGTSGTGTTGSSDVVPVNGDTINGQTGSSSGDNSSSTSGSSGSGSGMSFIPGSSDNNSGTGQSSAGSNTGSTSDNTQTGSASGANNWWNQLSSSDFQNGSWNNGSNNASNWQDWLSALKTQAQSQGWSQGSGDNSGAFMTGGAHWSGLQNTGG